MFTKLFEIFSIILNLIIIFVLLNLIFKQINFHFLIFYYKTSKFYKPFNNFRLTKNIIDVILLKIKHNF